MPARKLHALQFLSLAGADVAKVRKAPAALAKLLRRKTGRASLGRYWHGVQYLLAEGAKNVREPLRWLTSGGEVLGRNALGEVRWLAPEQAGRLAKAFVDESPDELGHGVYDEAEMDAAGVYPGCWRRLASTYDPLGTMRELFSYAREFLEKRLEDEKGLVLFLEEEPETFDDEAGDEDADDTPAPAPAPPPAAGATILTGGQGRQYVALAASKVVGEKLLARVDGDLGKLGYAPAGDFTMLPLLADGVVRSYVSSDRKSAAFALMSAERGVGSTSFSSRLGGDALVQVSDAFMLEIKKAKFFGSTVSRGTPPQLHAALLERRAALEAKHGPAVALGPGVETTAGLFELYWSKITGRR